MKVKHLSSNVLQEARKRIKRMIVSSDEVWVGFSGGKDSLVVLSLVEEQIKNEKINVVFRDEEMIPTAVYEFVMKKKQDPRYNFVYIATQMESDITILGQSKRYIQWDKNRKWVREKPNGYIEFKGVQKQEEFEKWFFKNTKHSIGLALGLRADESLLRRQGFMKSKHPFYRPSLLKNVTIYNPIYDWSEKDIFKYLYDNNIEYCKSYDLQVFSSVPLRVATVLHSESSRHLAKLKEMDTVLYNQLMEIFPEVEIQARYHKEAKQTSNKKAVIFKYKELANGNPLKAIYLYIEKELEGLKKQQAQKTVLKAKLSRENRIKKVKKSTFGGYPYYYVFEQILKGSFKRISIMPTTNDKEVYYEFENIKNNT